MRILVQVLRVFVGLLFIFSGLIKANDPLGLAYKMDEYFAVWNWHSLSAFTLYMSIGMNVLEIVAGIALLIGWWPKFITRLLLVLIIFFTFLTGYAVLSGKIKTCGCFGDCIPLKAWQSFLKDLLLLAAIVVSVAGYRYINALMPKRALFFLVLFSAGFTFWGQLHVLKNLPFVDCLPYRAGNNLLKQMEPPPGSIPDSTSIQFVYKHAGKEVSFDANSFPDNFDESTYEFVRREEKLVRKGNAEPKIKDFALFTSAGEDTTKLLLNNQGRALWLFWRNPDLNENSDWKEVFDKILTISRSNGVKVFVVSNMPVVANTWFNSTNRYNLPVLTCDGTVMKTILRKNVGMVAMNGAVVQGKWSEANLNNVITWIR